jgi:hypothetical protein
MERLPCQRVRADFARKIFSKVFVGSFSRIGRLFSIPFDSRSWHFDDRRLRTIQRMPKRVMRRTSYLYVNGEGWHSTGTKGIGRTPIREQQKYEVPLARSFKPARALPESIDFRFELGPVPTRVYVPFESAKLDRPHPNGRFSQLNLFAIRHVRSVGFIYIRCGGATIRRVLTGASRPASPPIPLDGRERSNRAV